MNRWAMMAAALALAVLAAAPGPAGAQAKDTLTVALVSHAPTLDPHMHFERVGDSREHQHVRLAASPKHQARVRAGARHVLEGGVRHRVGVQAQKGRALPQRRDHDAGGRQVLLRAGARPDEEVAAVRQYPRDQGSEGGGRRDGPHHHGQALPPPARAPRLLPHRAQEARPGRRRSGLRDDGARRHGPVEVRRVEARPAHPPRGLRPVLARQAAVQAARLPRHPRVRHAVRGDQDGRRRHHPRGLRRHHARAQDPSADLRLLDAHPARPLRRARHAVGALRQEGGAAGGELRDRQADHHAEADGGPRHAGRHRRCSRSPSASIPR